MKRVSFIATALLVAGAAFAQGPGGPPGPRGEFGPGGFGPHGIPGMRPGKVVTGAPFNATFTETLSQTLPGNTINRTTTGTIARDNQGRTYFTETITSGPMAQNGPTTLTFLFDPVAGYSFVLNAQTKVATRRAIKAHNGEPPPPPEDSASAGGNRPPRPGVTETTLSTPPTNWGVNVTGKQITHTIPAGTIGNSAPIVSTSTIWYATDLQTVVYSTHSDPRFGTSTYQLSKLTPGEPTASLFQVPSGYTVEDAPRFGHRPGPPPAQ